MVLTLGFSALVGSLAIDVQENGPIMPPNLEAVYRQVSLQTGVPWAALAAWDGAANGFALPVRSVDVIFTERVEWELERRRQRDERWCRDNPEDAARCPPSEPILTPEEHIAIWEGAYRSWHFLLREYVEQHAYILLPHVAAFYRNPEGVYQQFLAAERAARASDLFEGYQILEGLESAADEVFIDAGELPENWTPADGFAWPVVAPLTSRFGMRFSPIDGRRRLHAGIDLGIPAGTPIRASKAGRIVQAEFHPAYGQMVVIDHVDGYRTLYAHASALTVRAGQVVGQGDVVALAGSTGASTGPHLHFEVPYQGTPVDPLLLLTQRTGRS